MRMMTDVNTGRFTVSATLIGVGIRLENGRLQMELNELGIFS